MASYILTNGWRVREYNTPFDTLGFYYILLVKSLNITVEYQVQIVNHYYNNAPVLGDELSEKLLRYAYILSTTWSHTSVI